MRVSEESWSVACGHVLTTQTAEPADKEACRKLMQTDQGDLSWPGAFALGAFFIAVAWGFPRFLRAVS